MATPTYTAIASITLGSSASSVTFSSIPQDYRDLVLVMQGGLNDPGVSVEIEPNGSSADGSLVRAVGNGSSATSDTFTRLFSFMTGSDSMSIIQVMDYSVTDKHKTFLFRDSNTTNVVMSAGRWAQTTAITSLVIGDAGGFTLDAGTTLALYGIAA